MAPEMNSAGWSISYSQYLARSAALATRTLNLYQLALDRVSQGKLPPTIFQDFFPAFAVAHTAEFTNRVAEVGSRFLSGLVQLGSKGSATAIPDGEIVPPRFDAANPATWYSQLAEYAGKMNARALRAYREQLDRVAAGEATPSEVQQQTAQDLAQQLPSYLERLTELYFDLLNGLNEVRAAYEETYFRGLLAKASPDGAEPLVTVTLAGPSGSTATASLSITNTTRHRAQISRRVGDLRRPDGVGPSFVPAIAFAPDTLELGPNDEGTLTLSLQLDAERYDADVLYTGSLSLMGGSDVPLEIELRVLATRPGPA